MSSGNGDSRKAFGVSGIRSIFLDRGLRVDRITRRYRKQLDPLSDRRLAKRYAQYVRTCDRAHAMYEDPSSWPARGLLSQVTRRLHVAHSIMRERGLHVPEREECWRVPTRSEVYIENLTLYDELPDLSRAELESALTEVEAALPGDPWNASLHQRQLIIWGTLTARDRLAAAEAGGALMEVHPAQARLLRERVMHEMGRQLGWHWTPTEAQQLLDAVGITTIEPEPDEAAPWQT